MAIGIVLLVMVTVVALAYVRRWRHVPVTEPEIRSLAVLPLENLSGNPEDEYFAAGMHDALIGELAQIGSLRVISRTSAMKYKESGKSVQEIARELKVDGIVEGSAYLEGDRVQIQVRLIQAQPVENPLWAQTYEKDIRDVLVMYSEVARAVTREIQVKLTPEEESRLADARQVNPETYKAYLTGMFHLNKSTPEGFERGLAYLQQAVENDPAEPLAHAGLALGYVTLGHGSAAQPDVFPRARVAALTALKLDETLAEAHSVLADVKLYYEWDWAGAEDAFQRAMELNPNHALTHYHYAWYLALFGRLDEAIEEHKRAQELDPLMPLHTAWLGRLYQYAGRYEEAIDEARKSLELNPDFPVGHFVLGEVYAEKGMYEEAIAAAKKAAAVNPAWRFALGSAYALAGRKDEARKLLAELEAEEPTQWNEATLSGLYVSLGENDKAIRQLEVAYKLRAPWLPWIRVIPNLKPLRDDPRFQDLLRRMNVPQN